MELITNTVYPLTKASPCHHKMYFPPIIKTKNKGIVTKKTIKVVFDINFCSSSSLLACQ